MMSKKVMKLISIMSQEIERCSVSENISKKEKYFLRQKAKDISEAVYNVLNDPEITDDDKNKVKEYYHLLLTK